MDKYDEHWARPEDRQKVVAAAHHTGRNARTQDVVMCHAAAMTLLWRGKRAAKQQRRPASNTRGSSPPCHRADEDLSEEIAGDLQLPDGQRVGSTPDS
jgi:hypothetical protein